MVQRSPATVTRPVSVTESRQVRSGPLSPYTSSPATQPGGSVTRPHVPSGDNKRMTEPQIAAEGQPTEPSRTPWIPLHKTPLRQFLATETSSAAILAAVTLTALIWSDVADGSQQ